jgi:hypothetical protein
MRPETAAQLAELHAELARVYQDLARETPVVDPERALTLPEAAEKLGMSVAWLSRRANWSRCGGFKDQDRRVKFPLSALDRYLKAQIK